MLSAKCDRNLQLDGAAPVARLESQQYDHSPERHALAERACWKDMCAQMSILTRLQRLAISWLSILPEDLPAGDVIEGRLLHVEPLSPADQACCAPTAVLTHPCATIRTKGSLCQCWLCCVCDHLKYKLLISAEYAGIWKVCGPVDNEWHGMAMLF